MKQEKRKDRRQTLHHTASIVLGPDRVVSCAILDVSDSGARLEPEGSDAVPDRFNLVLSGNGTPRRHCRVIWREGKQIGVTFENRPPLAERLV
ncbi:MAG TPA: PilZ domain-containing protein [Pseudolabrys sp.]|nr:PilZ domain-containing protein [Pseudolabrys sp.]